MGSYESMGRTGPAWEQTNIGLVRSGSRGYTGRMHLDHNLDHGQQTFPAKVQTVIILGFFTLAVIQVCLCTTAGFSYDIEWEAVLDNSQQMGVARL